MKIQYTLLVFAAVLFGSCRSQLKVDDAIDASFRREVDSLNGLVLRGLSEGRTEAILKLCSDGIRKSDSDRVRLRRLVKLLHGLPLRNKPEVEHQLFSNKLRPDTTSAMTFREGTEQEYTFSFFQPGRPTLATFGHLPVDVRELGFATTFSRISGSWKLMGLEIGLYRMQGLNAVDWFYKTEQQLDAHDFVDALLQQTMAMSTLQPAGWNIRYRMVPRVIAQQQELQRELASNLEFPISTDPASNGAPRILGVSINCDSSCLPMFTVITRTPISDSTALAAECDIICKNLDHWFSGVSNRNKVVCFRLINKPPQEIRDSKDYITLYRPTVADWRY